MNCGSEMTKHFATFIERWFDFHLEKKLILFSVYRALTLCFLYKNVIKDDGAVILTFATISDVD